MGPSFCGSGVLYLVEPCRTGRYTGRNRDDRAADSKHWVVVFKSDADRSTRHRCQRPRPGTDLPGRRAASLPLTVHPAFPRSRLHSRCSGLFYLPRTMPGPRHGHLGWAHGRPVMLVQLQHHRACRRTRRPARLVRNRVGPGDPAVGGAYLIWVRLHLLGRRPHPVPPLHAEVSFILCI